LPELSSAGDADGFQAIRGALVTDPVAVTDRVKGLRGSRSGSSPSGAVRLPIAAKTRREDAARRSIKTT
jgi:4-hydroxyphenylpyruvate dioxygenase-like putative hemolysin